MRASDVAILAGTLFCFLVVTFGPVEEGSSEIAAWVGVALVGAYYLIARGFGYKP
jgi:hypothetical protein